MLLNDVCRDYLLALQHEQSATVTTVRTYRSYLNGLLRWMRENLPTEAPTLDDFNTPALRRYFYASAAQGLRHRTLRGRFHPIHGIAKFLVTHGMLTTAPTAAIAMPKRRTFRFSRPWRRWTLRATATWPQSTTRRLASLSREWRRYPRKRTSQSPSGSRLSRGDKKARSACI